MLLSSGVSSNLVLGAAAQGSLGDRAEPVQVHALVVPFLQIKTASVCAFNVTPAGIIQNFVYGELYYYFGLGCDKRQSVMPKLSCIHLVLLVWNCSVLNKEASTWSRAEEPAELFLAFFLPHLLIRTNIHDRVMAAAGVVSTPSTFPASTNDVASDQPGLGPTLRQ